MNIPSDSDISGIEDDSDIDETYRLPGEAVSSSDSSESDEEEAVEATAEVEDLAPPVEEEPVVVPVAFEAGGDASEASGDPSEAGDQAGRPAKRRRVSRIQRQFKEGDLPPQIMPENAPKPKGMDECRFEVDFFVKLFGSNNINLLTEQSNLFRAQESIRRNKNIPAITEQEIRQIIGSLLYMSVVTLPGVKLYWRRSLRNDMVANVMPRNRFEQILSLLHISDNTKQPAKNSPQYDRLYKIRPLLNNCAANFEDCAEWEAVNAVDEQMCPFKGKLGIKVYIANKPIKRGVKIFALAGQSGYLHRFSVAGDNIPRLSAAEVELLEDQGIGMSGQVVLGLLTKPEPPPDGTQVFFDNYFASPALLTKLLEMQVPAACTLRRDRMDSVPLKSEKTLRQEGRGSMDFKLTDAGILLLRWFDSKEVNVGSNHYSAHPTRVAKRWDKKEKQFVDVNVPSLISAYNSGMGGVDYCDQFMSFYRYC